MMNGFLNMGGYAAFVWPSFIVTGLVMVGLWLLSVRAFHRTETELAALEEGQDKNNERVN